MKTVTPRKVMKGTKIILEKKKSKIKSGSDNQSDTSEIKTQKKFINKYYDLREQQSLSVYYNNLKDALSIQEDIVKVLLEMN